MTQARTDVLTARFTRWVERFEPRKALREKPQALADELNALLRIVLKAAPSQGYEDWLEDVLERLDLTMTTSAWPTTGQLASALETPRTGPLAGSGSRAAPAWSPDPYAINAGRIRVGEPVGQEWLYGRNADEMLRRGLVSASDLEPYRKALRRDEERAHGPERAAELERERMTQRYHLATPVDGSRAGTWGQMGKPASAPSDTPRPYTPEELAQVRRSRGIPEPEPDWVPDYEGECP